jgi:small conductance mechanosensitive channel
MPRLRDALLAFATPSTTDSPLQEATGAITIATTATLRILITIAGGIFLTFALRFLIHRMTHRIVSAAEPLARFGRATSGSASVSLGGAHLDRRKQRAETLDSVLGSTVVAAVGLIVLVMVLGQLGWNLAPLLASAGVLGLAIGFGAQSLVKDLLSGVFMMIEDQYGVGDLIDIGTTSGTVEGVGLRVTRIRDANGTLWYCRNGEILRVGNESQGWSRAIVEVRVDAAAPLDHTYELLRSTAETLSLDDEWSALVIGAPSVAFVADLAAAGTQLQVTFKVQAGQQGKVASELRRRIRGALDAAEIALAS